MNLEFKRCMGENAGGLVSQTMLSHLPPTDGTHGFSLSAWAGRTDDAWHKHISMDFPTVNVLSCSHVRPAHRIRSVTQTIKASPSKALAQSIELVPVSRNLEPRIFHIEQSWRFCRSFLHQASFNPRSYL